ncbi:MAG: type II CAAX prenyl endopeptidase Rce1 family protein [Hyphomicrobiales bacterium]
MLIDNFLNKTNRILFIGCGVALMYVINITIASLPFSENMSDVPEINEFKENGLVAFFFIAVLIVPVYETLIFQYIPIKATKFVLKNQKQQLQILSAIILSSLLFSLSHWYNITYIITTFLGGIILAYSFILSYKRKESPILNVFIIHSIYNAIVFAIDVSN